MFHAEFADRHRLNVKPHTASDSVPTRSEFGMNMTFVPSSMHVGAADARIVGYVDLQYLQCTSLNIAAPPKSVIVSESTTTAFHPLLGRRDV